MTPNGILAPIPAHARYLSLRLHTPASARAVLQALAARVDGERVVAGLGAALVSGLAGADAVPGLRAFTPPAGARVPLPATPVDLWLWLRGQADESPGDLLRRGHALLTLCAPAFALSEAIAAFRHGAGHDLTGYEDGTENPQGEAAAAVAFVSGQGAGLDGGSLLSLQRWQHDFGAFDAMSTHAQDHAIGRRRSDNEELDDAPETAHVKRTAQEDFAPEAFVLRRSRPWAEGEAAGLYFTAFAARLDAFEAQLARMSGAEDGQVDALFGFSRPLTGAHLWCPPMRADGGLDLRALGLGG
jgi:putative iron-dependent peroxidase